MVPAFTGTGLKKRLQINGEVPDLGLRSHVLSRLFGRLAESIPAGPVAAVLSVRSVRSGRFVDCSFCCPRLVYLVGLPLKAPSIFEWAQSCVIQLVAS